MISLVDEVLSPEECAQVEYLPYSQANESDERQDSKVLHADIC